MILCIEIFQTTEELHWQAKIFESEKKYMCSCIFLRKTACSVALGQCYQAPLTGHLILGNMNIEVTK